MIVRFPLPPQLPLGQPANRLGSATVNANIGSVGALTIQATATGGAGGGRQLRAFDGCFENGAAGGTAAATGSGATTGGNAVSLQITAVGGAGVARKTSEASVVRAESQPQAQTEPR